MSLALSAVGLPGARKYLAIARPLFWILSLLLLLVAVLSLHLACMVEPQAVTPSGEATSLLAGPRNEDRATKYLRYNRGG